MRAVDKLGRLLTQLVIVLVLIGAVWLFVTQYSYIFSKTVKGRAEAVERLVDPSTILAGRTLNNQLFSFAVAVRDEQSGTIYTASSEDRQWAVVAKGQCVTAKFYPYPFWNFDKADTYFNARLIQMYDCNSKVPTLAPPEVAATPAAVQPTPVPPNAD